MGKSKFSFLNILLMVGLIYLIYMIFSSVITIKNEVMEINKKLDRLPAFHETASTIHETAKSIKSATKTIENRVEDIHEQTDDSTLLGF